MCCYWALEPIASEHAYLCAHPVIAFSPIQSHLILFFPADTLAAFFKATFCSSATWQSWLTQHKACFSLTVHLVLLCRHDAFQRTECPLPPFLSIFSPALALFACGCGLRRFLFHRLQTGVALRLFLDLNQTTQCFDLPIFLDNCSYSDFDNLNLSHITSCSDFDKLSRTTSFFLFLRAFGFLLDDRNQFLFSVQPSLSSKNPTAARDCPPSVRLHACSEAFCSSYS